MAQSLVQAEEASGGGLSEDGSPLQPSQVLKLLLHGFCLLLQIYSLGKKHVILQHREKVVRTFVLHSKLLVPLVEQHMRKKNSSGLWLSPTITKRHATWTNAGLKAYF